MWPFGGEKKPNMSAKSRVTCYNHRDAYFECLDKNGEESKECTALGGKYHDACLEAWVKYFDLQRKRLKVLGKDWQSPNMEGDKGVKNPQRA